MMMIISAIIFHYKQSKMSVVQNCFNRLGMASGWLVLLAVVLLEIGVPVVYRNNVMKGAY